MHRHMISRALALLLVALRVASATRSDPRSSLFNDGWRFFRGDAPAAKAACPSSLFPSKIGRCYGLTQKQGVSTEDECRQACCDIGFAGGDCKTWQWCPSGGCDGADAGTCWIGSSAHCDSGVEGWVTAGRSDPWPVDPTPPSFAAPSYDDSQWRALDLPHDWAIEDLPNREDDVTTPAITIRNGTWRFHRGDDAGWSAPGLDDSQWPTVTVPHDWREPPVSYNAANATGWYRRSFTLTAAQLTAFATAAQPPTLALGPVACTDDTFVNGVKVGGTDGQCLEFRSYGVGAAGILKEGRNTVAVRVQSAGGKAGDTNYPNAEPGGLCDAGGAAVNGVAVASGGDWQPPSPFDPARTSNGRSIGYSVVGVGWYRKTFKLSVPASSSSSAARQYGLLFDGVYMNSDVWLNGHHLGNHPYGYTSFSYDLTPYLAAPGHANVLALRVRTLGATSRWYSGSGIFRHVHLIATPKVHLGQWGVAVSTMAVAPDKSMAEVRVAVTVVNDGDKAWAGGAVDVDIMAPPGLAPARASADFNTPTLSLSRRRLAAALPTSPPVVSATLHVPAVAAGKSVEVVFDGLQINGTFPVNGSSFPLIALWDVDTPHLYSARVRLLVSRGAEDATDDDALAVSFGIRTIDFSAEEGFLLNGVPTIIKGGCVHHDNGPLGSAAIDRAEERRVENLKRNGYNAIRTSHNPVSPAFLDACDRLGVLVMDEAFDCWERGKQGQDYHLYFDAWWQRDMTSMVKRDRNHPSVVMWSIGNEIPMRDSSKGYELARSLANYVRALDPYGGRALTSAVPGVHDADDAFFAALDVGGYNYSPDRYESDHARFPQRVMVGTESFPTASWDMYQHYTNNSWVLGDFIWTAIDYIGESAIGSAATSPDLQVPFGEPWQWHISWCGDIDIVGLDKPQAAYRKVLWDASDMGMLVHKPIPAGQTERVSGWGWPDERDSWTWPGHEGEDIQVRVFSKCGDAPAAAPGSSVALVSSSSAKVSLKLNGEEVAGSPMVIGYDTQYVATFTIKYAPGKLTASCVSSDDPSSSSSSPASVTLVTAGAPASLKVEVDRTDITADRNDLAYATVTVVDAAGVRVPDHRVRLALAVSGIGVGELTAVGSGDPTDVSSFHTGTRTTFQGRVVAILRPIGAAKGGKPGEMTLTVTPPAGGPLKPVAVTVTTH